MVSTMVDSSTCSYKIRGRAPARQGILVRRTCPIPHHTSATPRLEAWRLLPDTHYTVLLQLLLEASLAVTSHF